MIWAALLPLLVAGALFGATLLLVSPAGEATTTPIGLRGADADSTRAEGKRCG